MGVKNSSKKGYVCRFFLALYTHPTSTNGLVPWKSRSHFHLPPCVLAQVAMVGPRRTCVRMLCILVALLLHQNCSVADAQGFQVVRERIQAARRFAKRHDKCLRAASMEQQGVAKQWPRSCMRSNVVTDDTFGSPPSVQMLLHGGWINSITDESFGCPT